jgi:hypothetical protein
MPFALGGLVLTATSGWADGCFVEPVDLDSRATGITSPAQKGVMIELPEGREVLLLQTTYHGPSSDFAWIIPVPGKPSAEDVFLASPEFIDAVLALTGPQVRTTIVGEMPGRARPGATLGSDGGLGGAAAEARRAVKVHERMKVGSYDVTVLSADRLGVVTDWLSDNGYRIPADSEVILDRYVMRGWYFVALRMHPDEARTRPFLKDVQPMGIRFDTDGLVYPLTISRLSSRQKTALLLVALTDGPVDCDQLSDARLPLGRTLEKGTSYAAVRRHAVDRPGGRLACEYRVPLDPEDFADLHYAKDQEESGRDEEWLPADPWATRWWTLLDRREMVDLDFGHSASDRVLQLTVLRKGEALPPPPYTRLRDIAGRGGILGTQAQLQRALEAIDHWLGVFHQANGCYPMELTDLAGIQAPQVGVDSSGNPLSIPHTARWHRPLGPGMEVRDLPVDPLTGQRDTWVYEPTGTPMVDSGGYEITLETHAVR